MFVSLRHKVTVALLAIYWPVFFIFAHIPFPDKIRAAGVSDKGLHFLAYMVLTFLLWFSLRPNDRARWRDCWPWLVLVIVLLYALVDEATQGLIGRSCDVRDVIADAVGAVGALVLVSLSGFWPAALTLVGIVLFGAANVTRVNLADVIPVCSSAFHVAGYATFTALWIQWKRLIPTGAVPSMKQLLSTLSLPLGFLGGVTASAAILQRDVSVRDTGLSVVAVAATVAVFAIRATYHSKYRVHTQKKP